MCGVVVGNTVTMMLLDCQSDCQSGMKRLHFDKDLNKNLTEI